MILISLITGKYSRESRYDDNVNDDDEDDSDSQMMLGIKYKMIT